MSYSTESDEDDWETDYYSLATVKLDCLMPNGILIQLIIDADSTIAKIKLLLWNEARKHAFYNRLKDQNLYVLTVINSRAEKVELSNEEQRLSDAEPFRWFVQVREKKQVDTLNEKYVNGQIGILIGRSIQQFDAIITSEISEFRKKMGAFCEQVAAERDRQSWHTRNKFLFPPNISPLPDLPPHLANAIQDGSINLNVSYKSQNFDLRVNVGDKPSEIVNETLRLWSDQADEEMPEFLDDYLLKVCGREEYFYSEYPLLQYTYIRKCIARSIKPLLTIQFKDHPPEVPNRGRSIRQPPSAVPPPPSQNTSRHRSIWDNDVKDLKFKLQVDMVSNATCADQSRAQLRLGIFHGGEALCGIVNTQEVILEKSSARWNETLEFDIKLSDIPRMARLCMTLYSCDKQKKLASSSTLTLRKVKDGRQEVIPLAWANIPMFDYQGCLQLGPMPSYFWAVTNDDVLSEEMLNPIGTVEGNPQKDQCVSVMITFLNFGTSKHHLYYPPFEKVIEKAADLVSSASSKPRQSVVSNGMQQHNRNTRLESITDKQVQLLRQLVDRHPLTELTEQDKEKIWNLRYEYQFHLPSSLPRLLNSIQWNNHSQVAEMQALLQVWREIPATQALELLDFAYADIYVRNFAVKCLKSLSDSELLTYLLQLVQVLKYESFIDCDLVRFLLERALKNQTVGHNLFWLLRSEMHVPSVSVRFGLILEAYLRGNIKYLDGLLKQVNHLGRLAAVAKTIKSKSNVHKDVLQSELRQFLQQQAVLDVLNDSACILDPCLRIGKPLIEKSRVMMSKMKPLYLVFENKDPQGDKIFMMYKKGDDLRQDMLTLQIIRIMDNIWQSVGLDLRLNAYGCLTTGNQEGLIEVVTDCDTVANIQKDYSDGKSSLARGFSKECLYRWLRAQNPDDRDFQKALNEFTLSCVGYSVATYVLGIGDRHSDNFLLKANGQLLHIDFGHFLGNFKSKLGFQRERVPFVLTHDFVYVICRGPKEDNKEFEKFQKLCEDAYMTLRRQSYFLIVLFLMMMNTGIPELSSHKNIRYLLSTLVPHLSDEEALAHWRSKLREALKNSFWSSLNNAFHHMNKS